MDKKIDLPIQVVSQRTGLSPHLIRIWEKRYQAVIPARSKTKRRLYTEEDVEKLYLLKNLTEEGHRISQIAQLPIGDLQILQEKFTGNISTTQHNPQDPLSKNLIETCFDAIKNLDSAAIDLCFAKATVSMSPLATIETFITPLLSMIGENQRKGFLRIVNAQFAYAALRPFLAESSKVYDLPKNAPMLIAATPAGQIHEFGALFLMTAAASCGWRSTYLGCNLPIEEIAAGVHQLNSKLLALSVVYPRGDPLLHQDLLRLRRLLPQKTAIAVGGEGADSYASALKTIRAIHVSSLSQFQEMLERFPESISVDQEVQ